MSASSSCQVCALLVPLALLWALLLPLGVPFLSRALQGSVGTRQCQLSVSTDGPLEEGVVTEDFQGLQAEVQAGSEGLEHMEKALRRQLLGALGRVLRDLLALQALESSVSRDVWGCTGPPASSGSRTLPVPSWSRACAMASEWSSWTVQQVPCSNAWYSPPECQRQSSLPLSSTCWGH